MSVVGIILVSTGCLVIASMAVVAGVVPKHERESLTLLGGIALILVMLGLVAAGIGEISS